MGTTGTLPNCKFEEIPVLGGFIVDRVEKDLADFTNASPDIDQAFIDAVKAKQANVAALVTFGEKTGELKERTKSLYSVMDNLKPKLDLLEIKLKRGAAQLGKPVSAFGLPKLRANIKAKNAEGLLAGLALLLREIDNNTAALQAKGFTAAMRAEFAADLAAIGTYNKQQNEIMDQRGELTAENKAVLIDYWRDISELLSIGKLLYANNPVKKKEYTFASLRPRVRRKSKKAEQSGEGGTGEGGGVVEG